MKKNIYRELKEAMINPDLFKEELTRELSEEEIVDKYYKFQGLSIREKIQCLEYEKAKLLNLENIIEDQRKTQQILTEYRKSEYSR